MDSGVEHRIAELRLHQREAVATWEEAVDLEQHALDEAEAARRIQAAAKQAVAEDGQRIDRLLELIPKARTDRGGE